MMSSLLLVHQKRTEEVSVSHFNLCVVLLTFVWCCTHECFYSYTVGGNAGSLKSKFENLARAEEEVNYLNVSTSLLI